ncbi:MAG: hypothetical protein FJY54_02520 [Betaproteobacteria bacterium]|nr:hypothetical protein [Betaproteobacteria bacterium]
MGKTKPHVVVFNLALVAMFCFGVAFFPYFLSSSGEGADRVADMFSAIEDAYRVSPSIAVSSFYIPFVIGLFSLAAIAFVYVPRLNDKLPVIVKTLSFVSVVLVLLSSVLIQNIHVSVIALIPMGFALLSSRKLSGDQR